MNNTKRRREYHLTAPRYLFDCFGKLHYRIVMINMGQQLIKHVGFFQLQRGCVHTGMTADKLALKHASVDDEPHVVPFVVYKPQNAYGTGPHTKILLHGFSPGEGQTRTAELRGQVLGLKRLVPLHKQKVEVGTLAVCQEQVLANGKAQSFSNFLAVVNGVSMGMICADVGYTQTVEHVVTAELGIAAFSLRRATVVCFNITGCH